MNSMKNWIIAKILSIEIYPPFPFQVFLRAGVLSHLDEEREDKLRDQVVRLQAVCRGHLARRHVQKLKVTIKLQQKSCFLLRFGYLEFPFSIFTDSQLSTYL